MTTGSRRQCYLYQYSFYITHPLLSLGVEHVMQWRWKQKMLVSVGLYEPKPLTIYGFICKAYAHRLPNWSSPQRTCRLRDNHDSLVSKYLNYSRKLQNSETTVPLQNQWTEAVISMQWLCNVHKHEKLLDQHLSHVNIKCDDACSFTDRTLMWGDIHCRGPQSFPFHCFIFMHFKMNSKWHINLSRLTGWDIGIDLSK